MGYTVELVWGVVSLGMYLLIWYYNDRVVRNFKDNEKVAATRIFLQGRTGSAFKVFAIGLVFYGLLILIGITTLSINDEIYRYSAKIGASGLFISWIYFMKTMAAATGKPPEDNTNGQDIEDVSPNSA